MQWNLEGKHISAWYPFGGYDVEGYVESSRVKYGGGVQHTLVLDKLLHMPWRQEPADRLLINHEHVNAVRDRRPVEV